MSICCTWKETNARKGKRKGQGKQPEGVDEKGKRSGRKQHSSSKNKRKERRTKKRAVGKSGATKIKFGVETTPICGGEKKKEAGWSW